MEQVSLFDFIDGGEQFKPIKSTDWKWTMANDYPKKNGLKVFSCFACGGGSTMGYKLAGCDVLGCVEIDKRMNDVYVKNHNPKHNYLMDIRDFNNIPNEDLPEELFNLDILDGSPPCTTFSMSGLRQESWGKAKKFREGQAEQTLDDLSFVFCDTVEKLRPKVMIMENVEGLIKGDAWGYVQKIYKQLNDIGYQVRHWLCKGEEMGVPQERHRVFFIALSNDIKFDLFSLNMCFNYAPITFGEIKSEKGTPVGGTTLNELIANIEYGDKDLSYPSARLYNRPLSFFNNKIIYDDKVNKTIPAKCVNIRYDVGQYYSVEDIINTSTFPQDYDFIKRTTGNVHYICGMSVPPIMIKRIVTRLIESGVFDYANNV